MSYGSFFFLKGPPQLPAGQIPSALMTATAYLNGELVAGQIPLGRFLSSFVIGSIWTNMEIFRLDEIEEHYFLVGRRVLATPFEMSPIFVHYQEMSGF